MSGVSQPRRAGSYLRGGLRVHEANLWIEGSSKAIMRNSNLSIRPLYLQLRDALAKRIATGEWKPHSAIPNEGDLAREFGVSPGTMRKALDLLESQRLLTRRQGRGTFVNDLASEEQSNWFRSLRGADGEPIVSEIRSAQVTQGVATKLECERLQVGANDAVHRISRVQFQAYRPFMVEKVVMPAALFPCIADKSASSAHGIAELAQQHGLHLGKAEERITIEAAAPEVATVLGIAPAEPIVLLDRVMLTLDGRPIEWRVGRCHLAGGYYLAEMH
jgi:GntR family transcriptional regulator